MNLSPLYLMLLCLVCLGLPPAQAEHKGLKRFSSKDALTAQAKLEAALRRLSEDGLKKIRSNFQYQPTPRDTGIIDRSWDAMIDAHFVSLGDVSEATQIKYSELFVWLLQPRPIGMQLDRRTAMQVLSRLNADLRNKMANGTPYSEEMFDREARDLRSSWALLKKWGSKNPLMAETAKHYMSPGPIPKGTQMFAFPEAWILRPGESPKEVVLDVLSNLWDGHYRLSNHSAEVERDHRSWSEAYAKNTTSPWKGLRIAGHSAWNSFLHHLPQVTPDALHKSEASLPEETLAKIKDNYSHIGTKGADGATGKLIAERWDSIVNALIISEKNESPEARLFHSEVFRWLSASEPEGMNASPPLAVALLRSIKTHFDDPRYAMNPNIALYDRKVPLEMKREVFEDLRKAWQLIQQWGPKTPHFDTAAFKDTFPEKWAYEGTPKQLPTSRVVNELNQQWAHKRLNTDPTKDEPFNKEHETWRRVYESHSDFAWRKNIHVPDEALPNCWKAASEYSTRAVGRDYVGSITEERARIRQMICTPEVLAEEAKARQAIVDAHVQQQDMNSVSDYFVATFSELNANVDLIGELTHESTGFLDCASSVLTTISCVGRAPKAHERLKQAWMRAEEISRALKRISYFPKERECLEKQLEQQIGYLAHLDYIVSQYLPLSKSAKPVTEQTSNTKVKLLSGPAPDAVIRGGDGGGNGPRITVGSSIPSFEAETRQINAGADEFRGQLQEKLSRLPTRAQESTKAAEADLHREWQKQLPKYEAKHSASAAKVKLPVAQLLPAAVNLKNFQSHSPEYLKQISNAIAGDYAKLPPDYAELLTNLEREIAEGDAISTALPSNTEVAATIALPGGRALGIPQATAKIVALAGAALLMNRDKKDIQSFISDFSYHTALQSKAIYEALTGHRIAVDGTTSEMSEQARVTALTEAYDDFSPRERQRAVAQLSRIANQIGGEAHALTFEKLANRYLEGAKNQTNAVEIPADIDLTPAQRDRAETALNILRRKTTDRDIEAADREEAGGVTLKRDGTEADHRKKVREASLGLRKHLSALEKSLKNPNLPEETRNFLEEIVNEAKRRLEKVKDKPWMK